MDFPALEPQSKDDYYRDKIVYFYYNLTRTKDLTTLASQFDDFIQVLKTDILTNKIYEQYAFIIYQLILHTRDQYDGKGEHGVSYLLIDVLYRHLPNLALACLYQFVFPCDKKLAYGSWRDIKHLCHYSTNEKLIEECIEIMNSALSKDILAIGKQNSEEDAKKAVSNVAKWIPRENKKFDWLFERLVINWSNKYYPYLLKNPASYDKALRKAKMTYRRLVARINTLKDTVEIKLCSNQWNKIDIHSIPQLAFSKYKNALCKYVFDSPEKIFEKTFYSDINMKRLECSLKTKKHLENKYYPEGAFEPNRPRASYVPFTQPLSQLVKRAFELIDQKRELEIDILNNEWSQLSGLITTKSLENMIPIIDMSFLSKTTEGYYSAISLALLVAQRSTLAKRILVIDNELSWVNLQDETNFVTMVKKLNEDTKSRTSTICDFTGTMKEFIKYIDDSKLSNIKIKEMSLVYFHTQPLEENTHSQIIKLFYNGGLTGSRNLVFPCPKMIYWNLSTTTCLCPSAINSKNSILLSGHNANLICTLANLQKDSYSTIVEILKEYTPSNSL
uniref:TROVE domain-containing protein n=1 Tax=viral metagenome TaxID=1070528 RepID=A0A6C0B3W5_9ZZZZ